MHRRNLPSSRTTSQVSSAAAGTTAMRLPVTTTANANRNDLFILSTPFLSHIVTLRCCSYPRLCSQRQACEPLSLWGQTYHKAPPALNSRLTTGTALPFSPAGVRKPNYGLLLLYTRYRSGWRHLSTFVSRDRPSEPGCTMSLLLSRYYRMSAPTLGRTVVASAVFAAMPVTTTKSPISSASICAFSGAVSFAQSILTPVAGPPSLTPLPSST